MAMYTTHKNTLFSRQEVLSDNYCYCNEDDVKKGMFLVLCHLIYEERYKKDSDYGRSLQFIVETSYCCHKGAVSISL